MEGSIKPEPPCQKQSAWLNQSTLSLTAVTVSHCCCCEPICYQYLLAFGNCTTLPPSTTHPHPTCIQGRQQATLLLLRWNVQTIESVRLSQEVELSHVGHKIIGKTREEKTGQQQRREQRTPTQSNESASNTLAGTAAPAAAASESPTATIPRWTKWTTAMSHRR